MRVLVIKAHPRTDSFCHAATESVIRGLESAGRHDVEVLDLYQSGFDPVLSEADWRAHSDPPATKPQVAEHIRQLRWAQAVVFVYPTWWSGPPAMLLGWMQRVLVSEVAFTLRKNGLLRGGLRWIKRVEVVTSHGSAHWVNWFEGQVGRMQLLRGFRTICHPFTRTKWHAMYKIDHSTHEQRVAFLTKVERSFSAFD